jgi:ISXO2-like transposase domain
MFVVMYPAYKLLLMHGRRAVTVPSNYQDKHRKDNRETPVGSEQERRLMRGKYRAVPAPLQIRKQKRNIRGNPVLNPVDDGGGGGGYGDDDGSDSCDEESSDQEEAADSRTSPQRNLFIVPPHMQQFTLRNLVTATSTERMSFNFAVTLGLLTPLPGPCPSCGAIMRVWYFPVLTGGLFRCTKACGQSFTLKRGSLFEYSHLTISKLLELTYRFCTQEQVTRTALQVCATKKTTCKWFSMLRGVMATVISHHNTSIGGPGHRVEIDEFHMYTPKHGKGRHLALGAIWGFGGIDVNTRATFCVEVVKRDRITLDALIKAYIKPGTHIYSDAWAAYKNLDTRLVGYNYKHFVVNHSKEYVNAEHPHIHTNTIERQWLTFRSLLPKTTGKAMLPSYFAYYLYYSNYKWSSTHPGARFALFCSHIAEVYPGAFAEGKIMIACDGLWQGGAGT